MRASRSAGCPDRVTPGEVHAWLIDLDLPSDDAGTALGPAEVARAGSYVSPRDGARYAASRAWLRVLLGRYLDADPGRLLFERDSSGRPALAGEHVGLLYFSLSRSAGRCLVAVSRSPVGADIELVRGRAGLADLVIGRFGASEARCIADGCAGSPLRGFYRHWTAKEAYLKATGRGLAGLGGTELICDKRPAIRAGGQAANWTVSLLDAAPDCAGAIAGRGPVTRCGAGN
jgi:4'-phosphopantetheinyl transferase